MRFERAQRAKSAGAAERHKAASATEVSPLSPRSVAIRLEPPGWLSNLLFQVRAGDPATFALAPPLLIAIAIAASWLPVRRAARVDPMVALRYE